MVADDEGNAYVLGTATSDDFPMLNPLQPNFGGGSDAFLAQLDSTGALIFSTFLGGDGFDEPRDLGKSSLVAVPST